jgi:hypothetical protein
MDAVTLIIERPAAAAAALLALIFGTDVVAWLCVSRLCIAKEWGRDLNVAKSERRWRTSSNVGIAVHTGAGPALLPPT